jgi:hypothetical protein
VPLGCAAGRRGSETPRWFRLAPPGQVL